MLNFADSDYGFIDYLTMMTDDTGILQHSVYGIPDPRKGYTTDDNCRALILSVLLFERFKEQRFLKLIYRYLGFVLNAQNEKGGFKNFMDYNRNFIEEEGSGDCFGRCLWAVCRTYVSESVPMNIRNTCGKIITNSIGRIDELKFPRSKALVIIGLSYLDVDEENSAIIERFSNELVSDYISNSDKDWHWFEDIMTYGNSMIPWSLLRAYKIIKKEELLKIAKKSADFLEKATFKDRIYYPIGCKGWFKKGAEKPAEYDQQPLEAAEAILMYGELYDLTGEKKYLDYVIRCFNWYRGRNSKGLSLIDPETGACYDGIKEDGLNLNQGSESIVSLGIALMETERRVRPMTGHKTRNSSQSKLKRVGIEVLEND